MYEASFGLTRRPFAATPDATCFLATGPIQAVLDELVVCVEQGQGISILTAPAGTGKTLLCERLRFELDERFETVFLRHSSFLTRRALLQTVLCELNHPYHHPSEQELRLELFPAIRALQPKREALVLICDEAHQLPDSLLEELRILADFAEAGRPLVRLVLVGQLSLEEKLTQPSLDAFNQRIRAQINLSPFDHAGSIDYIDYRLTWAGGRTDEVFTAGALDLIARASDGVPRCINQLADHTLLLAFVAEQRPAGEELVREALNDLRQLPLHWNEPSESRSADVSSKLSLDDTDEQSMAISSSRDYSGLLSGSNAGATMYSYEPEETNHATSGWISLTPAGAATSIPQLETSYEAARSTQIERIEVSGDDWRKTKELFGTRLSESLVSSRTTETVSESTATATTEQSEVNLTRRMQFHDLLQDAYAAAAAKSSIAQEIIELPADDNWNEPIRIVEAIPEESAGAAQVTVSETNIERSKVVTTVHSVTKKSTSGFYEEEVIVDRYAAIDGGFTPPADLQPDTIKLIEVRAEESNLETECAGHDTACLPTDTSVTEIHESAEFREIVCDAGSCQLDSDATIDFPSAENDSTVVEDVKLADELLPIQTASPEAPEAETVATELTSTEISELTSLVASEVIETTRITRQIRSEQEVVWTEQREVSLSISEPLDDAPTVEQIRELSELDHVEQVAEEVYSLGQALHPAGVLSSNSESILKALRHEVGEHLTVESQDFGYQSPSVPVEATWESIETEPVAVTKEARPFRYLFSMLRRKQQGLA